MLFPPWPLISERTLIEPSVSRITAPTDPISPTPLDLKTASTSSRVMARQGAAGRPRDNGFHSVALAAVRAPATSVQEEREACSAVAGKGMVTAMDVDPR